MMLAVPLGLFMAVWLVIGLKRDAEVPIGLGKTFRASMTSFACVLILMLSSTAFGYYRVWEAMSYVDGIVPKLDEYHAKTGQYPTALEEIGAPAPPSLLASAGSYRADLGCFYFEYWQPFILGNGRVFDSETRRWENSDF